MFIVLDRARRDEWRQAVAVATRDVQAGKIKTLAQLRACLQREALAEPGKQRTTPPSGNGAEPSEGEQRAQTTQLDARGSGCGARVRRGGRRRRPDGGRAGGSRDHKGSSDGPAGEQGA